MGLRHVPLAYAGSGWLRRKARARTVPSPKGVWHSLLPVPTALFLPCQGLGVSAICG